MPRIAGVNIPGQKQVPYSLQYIYGIGRKVAWEICEKLSIDTTKKADDLTEQEFAGIRELLENEYTVEGQLRREVQMNIKRHMDIGSYRGQRHKKGLPVRGQGTKTNARTRKGPARAIAGKKKAPK